MVATKFLLMVLAAYVTATPVASAPKPATTQWKPLDIKATIDWDGIDKKAYQDPANWNTTDHVIPAAKGKSANPHFHILSGPCEQGSCPDYSAAFDLVYTFTAVPVDGDPPLTIFESQSSIRINDCNECLIHKVGSNLGNSVPGGCWDFRSCGRDQTICVDPGNQRAHRIWKGYVKKCYHMRVEYLGDCGFIKSRIVLHPDAEVPCNW
ncbi:hypothetical protein IWW34DRAFT_909383 [Fusarium oxysporum f. sp. albedinis]|nr:hypothetical protein IWW34DRAFT_909383 [Fusarium oxysporum f. sp. albedinis]KAJ0142468.1 Uncharacterized protein HZ326_14704 [Fusarium oxysporum f. sp. albedinis]KAK2471789.1 hypothetical protein H9L39_16780 [Fusarium oxysporum f. sp. albedinis]